MLVAGAPAVVTVITVITSHEHLTSDFSCWLNLGHVVSSLTLLPVGVIVILTFIITEAAAGYYVMPFPMVNRQQLFVGRFVLYQIIRRNILVE